MKIGIITFHFVPNQGAVLQCYAMQRFLEKQGHDAYVIDYRPGYHTVRYATRKDPFLYARWYKKRFKDKGFLRSSYIAAKAFVRSIRSSFKGTDKIINDLFSEFVGKNLHLTDEYTSLGQLQKAPPDMDVYISGSDQLWNPELLDQDFDPAYFLDFGQSDTKRITYAVSMGKLPDTNKISQLRELCKDLTAISLREYDSAVIDAIGKDVQVCLDPTFLIDVQDYAAIEAPGEETEPYIFVYGFETNEDIQAAVDSAVRKYGCRVINGSPTRIKLAGDNVINVRDYAPDRFLTFIKHAECVVTNSFHGTAFSVIYKKQFVTVPHTTRGKRMTELLGKIGLESCLWNGDGAVFDREIDYSKADEMLCALRDNSVTYLKTALESHIEH